MTKPRILALDQGTARSRAIAIVFDRSGRSVSAARKEFAQFYPKAGWVEHDAMKIRETERDVAHEALEKAAGRFTRPSSGSAGARRLVTPRDSY